MRTIIASVIVLLLGTWAAWAVTGRFQVLTSEQARRLEIARMQPAVPSVRLVDQDGQVFRFDEWGRKQEKLLIVDFIYTNCQSLCRVLGSDLQQMQRDIVERGMQDRVHLLSVSFDPGRDSPAMLRRYAGHMQASPDTWTFATVADVTELAPLLRAFGVTVIPDRLGGFQHNAALIWVSPAGRLVRVTDLGAGDRLALLNELAEPN